MTMALRGTRAISGLHDFHLGQRCCASKNSSFFTLPLQPKQTMMCAFFCFQPGETLPTSTAPAAVAAAAALASAAAAPPLAPLCAA